MKVKRLESEVFLLLEQLFVVNARTEALHRKKNALAPGSGGGCSWEHATLEEVSTMLSWAEATEKVKEAEVALEDSRENLIDSLLHSAALEKIIRGMKGKIAKDQAKPLDKKKVWVEKWEMTLWDSPKLNQQLGKRMFTFLQLGFNDCTA